MAPICEKPALQLAQLGRHHETQPMATQVGQTFPGERTVASPSRAREGEQKMVADKARLAGWWVRREEGNRRSQATKADAAVKLSP